MILSKFEVSSASKQEVGLVVLPMQIFLRLSSGDGCEKEKKRTKEKDIFRLLSILIPVIVLSLYYIIIVFIFLTLYDPCHSWSMIPHVIIRGHL